MRRYSATEAIGPAWRHTRSLLWQDRRRGRLLKLCLLAIGAQLGTFTANLNGNFGNGRLPREIAPIFAAFAAILLITGLVAWLGFFYLGSRLDLALFDVVLLRDDRVALAWQRHGRHTWRWMAVKAVTALVLLAVLSPLLVPASLRLVHFLLTHPLATPAGHGVHLDMSVVRGILLFVLSLAVTFLLFFAALQFVENLTLPGLAMEDLHFGQVFARAWLLFRTDKAGMLLFGLVQPLLMLLLGLAAGFAELLIVAVAALPLAAVGGLLWWALHGTGALSWLVLGLFATAGGLLLVVLLLLASVVLTGTLHVFSRAWTLYFLGGRYALLGQYLSGEPAVPVWTPPPSFPVDDDSSGPDLPLTPELA